MKIQLLAFSAILALLTVSSASADDELEVTNDSTNAVAVGGAGTLNSNTGGAGPYYGESFSNKRALAGSVLVSGCDCGEDKDVLLANTSEGSLAVGKGVSGSIVLR